MKKILFILATVLLCSCEKTTTVYSNKSNLPWDVVEIDSCEYIKDGYRLAHKGNCKYCRERNRKMIKDILTAIDYE
jgi:hypothetical protein